MSTTIAKNYQVGSDSTATNNFTIRQPATPDGTVRIANGNSGTTTDLVTVTSAGNVGVGTTSPAAKLHVAGGNIRLSDNQGVEWGGATNFIYGSNSTNILAFATNNTVRATLDSSGNLGLGVTPSAWSTVVPAFQIGGAGTFLAAQGNSTPAVYLGTNAHYNGSNWIYKITNAATRYDQDTGVHRWFTAPSGTAGNAISFTQAMTLDASGNLGINSTSPSTFGKVTVQVAGTTTPTNLTNVGPSSINLYAAANGGSTDSTMGIFGWNSTTGIGSGIGFVRENGSDWGTQIRFYTHPTTTSNIGDITERARIDSSGNLLVGKTTQNQGGTGVEIMPIVSGLAFGRINMCSTYAAAANSINFVYNGSVIGFIQQGTSSVSYNTTSDYRLKENIQPMIGALAKVAALKPCTYTWKADGSDGEGFIAHELAEVCPQAVTGEKDAVDAEGNPVYQGIDTSFLVATLTAAIQELKAELDRVKTELALLKGIA